jgi:hypothetical protein
MDSSCGLFVTCLCHVTICKVWRAEILDKVKKRTLTKQIKKCGQKPVGFVRTSQILANYF